MHPLNVGAKRPSLAGQRPQKSSDLHSAEYIISKVSLPQSESGSRYAGTTVI